MRLQACRSYLSLSISLSLSSALYGTLSLCFIAHPQAVNFPILRLPPAPASLVLSIPLSFYTCPAKRNS